MLQNIRLLRLYQAPRPLYKLFHSHQHEIHESNYNSTECCILKAALSHVPNYGFSISALIHGARDVGYLDVSANVFNGGCFDLVKYHLITQRQNLALETDSNKLQQKFYNPLSSAEKIRILCIERLKGNSSIVQRWPEALALMSLNENVAISAIELGKLSDKIWHLAGDIGIDTSWYTKRTMLSVIYASTEIYMTQDTSKDFSETWKFLDRRLEDYGFIGTAPDNVNSYFRFVVNASR